MREGAPTSHDRPEAGNFPLSLAYQGRLINVFTDDTGAPWWVGREVCAVLGLTPDRAMARLDEDEKGLRSTQTLGGVQSVTTINESGLYSLILRSRKPEAKAFKRWITREVLPAIRRTGGYGMAATPDVLARLARLEALIGTGITPAALPAPTPEAALQLVFAAWTRGEIKGEMRADGKLVLMPAEVRAFLLSKSASPMAVLRAWRDKGWLRPRKIRRGSGLSCNHRWKNGKDTTGYAIGSRITAALLSAAKGEVLQ